MPASTSGIKSPFCINTNQLSIFIILRPRPRTYPSTSPLLLLQLHQQQYLLSIINIINSTNHHLQHAKLRILLQHLTSHAAYERSGGPPKRAAARRPCIYILLSPDTQRPPSPLLTHSGAWYEISDLRDIYGAGGRNSAGSSGGCSSGVGPQSVPFSRRVRGALAPRRSLETRGVLSSGAGPSQNGTCLRGGIGNKIRARERYHNLFSVREDQCLYTPVSLHRVK